MSVARLQIRLRDEPPSHGDALDATLDVTLDLEAAAVAVTGGGRATRTRLLDLVAGFVRPREGVVRVGDATLTDTGARVRVSLRNRRVAWIPTGGGLFPHLTVGENLAFAVHRLTPENRERYRSMVAAFDLEGVLPLRPRDLTPRETLFAAVARALIARPRLILIEEPLLGLDPGRATGDLDDLLEKIAAAEVPLLLTAADATRLPRGIGVSCCTGDA